MGVPKSTIALFNRIPHAMIDSIPVVENFAVFIDTHRDMPHIGSFDDDLHRGVCKPTTVHALVAKDGSALLMDAGGDHKLLKLHDKHLFVSIDWYQDFVVNHLMTSGSMPIDDDGKMPTKLLRDPRTGIYLLKTFGNMVRERARKDGIK